MFKSIALGIFSLFLLGNLSAQRFKSVIVQTGDGSQFIGELVKESKKYVTIEILTGDTISIPRVLIQKYSGDEEYLLFTDGKFHETKGFFWGMDTGFNAASFAGDENNVSSQFSMWFGHRFNKDLAISGGLGFEFNSSRISGFQIDTQFSSTFVQAKYYLTDTKKRLFTYARLAYGSAAEDVNTGQMDHTSGMNFMYGIGINFAAKKRTRFVLSLGMYHQKTSGIEFFLDNFGNEIRTEFDFWVNRPILKFGMEFK